MQQIYAVENNGDVKRFESSAEAARNYGIAHSTVYRSLNRKHYFGVRCTRFSYSYADALKISAKVKTLEQ